jgi:6-phosphogluconolactonase
MKPAFGTLRVYEDATALAQAGADYLCDLTTGNPSRMIIALSGGNTPKPLYEHLAEEPIKSRLPWNRVHFILGDERFVPPSDPASNFGMASSAFLAHVSQPVLSLAQSAGECRRCRHSAPYAADYAVSVSRIWSRTRH